MYNVVADLYSGRHLSSTLLNMLVVPALYARFAAKRVSAGVSPRD
jgi:hypothetical protein